MTSPDTIGTALNIAPIPASQPPTVVGTPIAQANTDLEFAQNNLKGLVDKGNRALDSIIEVAELSQHPRAYEVVATTLTALANINKQITDVAKARKEMGEANSAGGPQKIGTQQNVFVGSTAELAKFLELKRG